jgi:hypothetical protein
MDPEMLAIIVLVVLLILLVVFIAGIMVGVKLSRPRAV